jgi:transposase InsO family protein
MTWKEFLKIQWKVMAAADFFTAEVWTPKGLIRYHVLLVIRLMTREVHIAGIVPEPGEDRMKQAARNLTDESEGFLRGSRYLIHDRATVFTEQFREIIKSAGVEPLRLPARSPNLNAFAERFVRSVKESCLDQLIFFGESSLRRAVSEFVLHYHAERNHQGLANKINLDGQTDEFAVYGTALSVLGGRRPC